MKFPAGHEEVDNGDTMIWDDHYMKHRLIFPAGWPGDPLTYNPRSPGKEPQIFWDTEGVLWRLESMDDLPPNPFTKP